MEPTEILRAVACELRSQGYRVRRTQKIHPKLKALTAPLLIARRGREFQGILFVKTSTQLPELLELRTMLSSEKDLKLAIAVRSADVALKCRPSCQKAGLGLYLVLPGVVQNLLAPESKNLEATVYKYQLREQISFINTITQSRWGFSLFKVGDLIEKLQLPCTEEGKFPLFVGGLSLIIDSINRRALRKCVHASLNPRATSLDYLHAFLVQERIHVPSSLKSCILIRKLRNNTYPIHLERKYKALCKRLTERQDPTFEQLILSCMSKFYSALIELRDSIK